MTGFQNQENEGPNPSFGGDRSGEAKSLNNLGLAYQSLGQYQRAIEYHQQSLAIKQEIGDRSGEA
ncbi:tetratricopeptide repeat protein, partial [Geitlerinema sp. PCC 9228]|uniref:tetratricopeptide repeat protein n=1 Tax=Geitlerinema sp. PCC 9228 TaxID=111611 RepID=UPI001B8B6829